MVKNGLVIGKPNAGKTLFIINFASFLGLHRLEAEIEGIDGYKRKTTITTNQARWDWVSKTPHKTRHLVSIKIHLTAGKGKKRMALKDSTGIMEGIPSDIELRKAIGQTLLSIREADLILHIVDTSQILKNDPLLSLGETDYQLAELGRLRKNYLMLANKIDIPESAKGLCRLKEMFHDIMIIPISALYKTGFSEVREYIRRNL